MFSRLAFAFLVLAACAGLASAQDQNVTKALNFTQASWIWSNDSTAGATPSVALTPRGFRKSISRGLLQLQIPRSIEIIMTADDEYTLYVNGVQIGSGSSFRTSQYYCVSPQLIDLDTLLGRQVVIAVNASNTIQGTPAGLLGAVKLNYLNGSEQYFTDGSWRSSPINATVPDGFSATEFDDSTWDFAVVERSFGASGQWNEVASAPAANQTCADGPILPPVGPVAPGGPVGSLCKCQNHFLTLLE